MKGHRSSRTNTTLYLHKPDWLSAWHLQCSMSTTSKPTKKTSVRGVDADMFSYQHAAFSGTRLLHEHGCAVQHEAMTIIVLNVACVVALIRSGHVCPANQVENLSGWMKAMVYEQ
jgi:hypothetical protein